jgi:hypothetical protein
MKNNYYLDMWKIKRVGEKSILKDLSDISDDIYSGILFKKELYKNNSDILGIFNNLKRIISEELNYNIDII